jgi:hypothetical protein
MVNENRTTQKILHQSIKTRVPYLEGTYRKNTDQNVIPYLEGTLQITEQEEFMTEKRVLV